MQPRLFDEPLFCSFGEEWMGPHPLCAAEAERMAMSLSDLPTLAEVEAARRGKPIPKGPSRLDVKTESAKDEAKEEQRWKREVWARDKGCCRWCKRKVQRVLDLLPDRGEVHHISGRVVRAIRWVRKNGLLLCLACHQRITGKVAERFLIVPKKTFTVDGVQYANADHPVTFKRIA